METKKVFKWYWVWDYEKEELWLNAMANQGWALSRVGWCTYYFEKTEPGEYEVRLECRKADDEYISFVQETGAEYLGRVFMWIYFRRKSEMGPFELNGDLDSRIAQLNTINRFILPLGLMNLGLGIANLHYSDLSVLNLLCATVLAYAYGRIQGKKDELQRERQLHE